MRLIRYALYEFAL